MHLFAPSVLCLALTPGAVGQDAMSALLDRSASVTSIAVTLDTPAGETGKPERIVLALDNRRRLAFAQYRSEDGTTYPQTPVSFLYFADGVARNSRVGRDIYIEHTDVDLWSNLPPRSAMLAPWPVLGALHEQAQTDPRRELVKTDTGATLRAPKFAYALDLLADGTLTGAKISLPESNWNVTFVDASPVQIGETTLALPSRVIERETTPEGERVTTWTVTSLDVNPADIDQRLAFDPAALNVKKWDVEAGKILDASGKQVGIEEIPAVRGVEVWEQTTKASAWIAVWKWGSIVAGLGLVGFVLDMIRRRL